jgi:hypothetical protein
MINTLEANAISSILLGSDIKVIVWLSGAGIYALTREINREIFGCYQSK